MIAPVPRPLQSPASRQDPGHTVALAGVGVEETQFSHAVSLTQHGGTLLAQRLFTSCSVPVAHAQQGLLPSRRIPASKKQLRSQ